MFGSDLLDLIIGVVFVWFLLSLAVAAVNDGLALVFRIRSKQLWRTLARTFDDQVKPQARLKDWLWHIPLGHGDQRPYVRHGDTSMSSSWRSGRATVGAEPTDGLQGLYRNLQRSITEPAPNGWRSRITNVPAELLSGALLDLASSTVSTTSLADAERTVAGSAAEHAAATAVLVTLPAGLVDHDDLLARAPDDVVRARLELVWAEAQRTVTLDDLEELVKRNPVLAARLRAARQAVVGNQAIVNVKREIERWFDAEMDALTRFYRRQNRKIALLISVVLVMVVQADTIRLVGDLRRDQDLRALVASDAAGYVKLPEGDAAQLDELCGTTTVEAGSKDAAVLLAAARARLDCAAKIVRTARPEVLPAPSALWTEIRREGDDPNALVASDVPRWVVHRIPGRIITVLALLFGAGFWYDVLRRLVGLRSSAKGPRPADT